MKTQTRYSPEVRERAVRLAFEHHAEYGSQRAALNSIAAKIGCTAETLRKRVRLAERTRNPAQSVGFSPKRSSAAGPGATPVYGDASQPVVGRGLHVRRHMGGLVYVAFVIDTFARRIVG